MARIALFHSEYGLRPAVSAAADHLRSLGHTVHVPDLLDGQLTSNAEEAAEVHATLGSEELLRRAVAAVGRYTTPSSGTGDSSQNGGPRTAAHGLVYAGFSLGAALAQNLALADVHAHGLVLLHGTSDLSDDAQTHLPVQLHVADPDPFEPEDWQTAWYLRMREAGADVEVHRYHGAGHLFTDDELPDHDADASHRTWATVAGFLTELDHA